MAMSLLSRLLVPLLLASLAGCVSDELDSAAAEPGARPPIVSSPTASPAPGAAPGSGSAALCVDYYSPASVAKRSFAFDGTVTAVGEGTTNKPGMGDLDTVAVTFEVTEWFRGGDGTSVTVDMGRGAQGSVGDRLLVSGEPRWGGPPLQDAIAWGGGECGDFTQDYDETVAAEWRKATA